jgi:exosortase E/protease (VPEID-CTERM system)
MRDWGPWILRAVVGSAVIFLTFAYVSNKAALGRIFADIEQARIGWRLLITHGGMLAVFAWISSVLYSAGPSLTHTNWLAAAWFAAGIAAIVCGALAFVPCNVWLELLRVNGFLWAYALAGATAACVVGNMSRALWHSASLATFVLTKALLSPFVSEVFANPAALSIGTNRFHVRISPACSGLEGVGLMLGFGTLWLVLFRRECRFPQSLALLPVGIAASFFLNSVRIAALILIGNAGAPQIAIGGFHSQAGWILFSAVAMGFCIAARNGSWFTRRPQAVEARQSSFENSTEAYLGPFLAILAAGMFAGAATGGFEWLYPLRFFAAAGALWFCRRNYVGLKWSCGWLAPVAGVAVFAVWIALDRFSSVNVPVGMPHALMDSAKLARLTWIGFRVLAAVVTVPIAEELAFRGFLLRRLVSADFDSLPFERFTWMAVTASSVIFGMLHGQHWLAGIIAGLVFALLVIRRGRIGDAVVAHATTNALLTGYVLLYGNWQFW